LQWACRYWPERTTWKHVIMFPCLQVKLLLSLQHPGLPEQLGEPCAGVEDLFPEAGRDPLGVKTLHRLRQVVIEFGQLLALIKPELRLFRFRRQCSTDSTPRVTVARFNRDAPRPHLAFGFEKSFFDELLHPPVRDVQPCCRLFCGQVFGHSQPLSLSVPRVSSLKRTGRKARNRLSPITALM